MYSVGLLWEHLQKMEFFKKKETKKFIFYFYFYLFFFIFFFVTLFLFLFLLLK